MPIIRVKRGTANPTTSSLNYVGEMGFNTTTNELFIRGNSSIIKVGGIGELVYSYQGSLYYHTVYHAFHNNYIYEVYILASTAGTVSDTSTSYISYMNSSGSYLLGSYMSLRYDDDYNTGLTRTSGRAASTFYINDQFSGSKTPTYGITKTISFELIPTFQSNTTTTYTWIAKGKSISSLSDDSSPTVAMAEFVHVIDGDIGRLYLNPGLNLGSPDTLQVSIYRKKRT